MALLRQHRGALIADFIRYYRATPFDLWRGGMHLLDIAAIACELPDDSATVRALNPEHEWMTLANRVAVATANEMRLFRGDVIHALGGKHRVELIRPESAEVHSAGVTKDQVGASEGFDSFAEARAWYLAHHPEMADRV